MAELQGGCACGAVRYRIAEVDSVGFCHCRRCQRRSGAGYVPVVTVSVDHIEVTGRTVSYADGAHGVRSFCPTCGTAAVEHDGDAVNVAAGTLDDPEAVRPTLHRHVRDQRSWSKYWDGLARHVDETAGDEPPGWRKPADPAITRQSTVSLREISDDDRMKVVSMQVAGSQMRFVAPNVLSLLQQMTTSAPSWLRIIYADEVPIGLCLFEFPTADEQELPITGKPFLWRYMVDEHYQGLGLGAVALRLAMEEMKGLGHAEMYLSCVNGPGSPKGFYERLGFATTGKFDEGEEIMRRPLD